MVEPKLLEPLANLGVALQDPFVAVGVIVVLGSLLISKLRPRWGMKPLVILGTEGDGLSSSECNGGGQPAGLLTSDGDLWIPTIAGIVVVDTRVRRRRGQPPPVLIESASLNGTEVPLRNGRSHRQRDPQVQRREGDVAP